MDTPDGAQLVIHDQTGRLLFYKHVNGNKVELYCQNRWCATSFSSLQNVVDLWDEVHTWL